MANMRETDQPDRGDSTMPEPCTDCALDHDRRDFVHSVMALIGGIWVGLGLSPRAALAMPLNFTTGRRGPAGPEVTYPIPPTDGATIDKPNEIILVRAEGMVYAFALSCPHQNTALKWLDDDKMFQCPKHKSRYKPDGTFISGRATRNMDRLPLRSDGKNIYVNGDKTIESDKDQAGWAAAGVKI